LYLRFEVLGLAVSRLQHANQKIAAFGSPYGWIARIRQKRVDLRAAFASRLAPTEKQKQKQGSAAARGEAAPLKQ
jgi:hypothetical protein